MGIAEACLLHVLGEGPYKNKNKKNNGCTCKCVILFLQITFNINPSWLSLSFSITIETIIHHMDIFRYYRCEDNIHLIINNVIIFT